jgi:hypothetical protein
MGLLALGLRRGSLAAFLCWPGVLAFTTYNYVIYAFSVHFGALFLMWVAVLGLSVFGLVGALVSADMPGIARRFGGRAMPGTAVFLIVIAGLFAMLWLREILSDLMAGNPSSSARDWQVPSNPVHVLDLAFFLPAVITSGVLLLRRHPFGYATAAAQLLWLALTCLPILVTPLVADHRAHQTAWAVMAPIGLFLVALLAVLGHLLRGLSANGNPAGGRHPDRP